MSNNIRVVCRFRPPNQKEKDLGSTNIVSCDESGTQVTIKGAESNHSFSFDRVFVNASQKDVYDYSAKPVVEDILRGYNGTIFVYGQTSSGKTHTMQGPNIEDQELKGIIPRMNGTIFESIANADPNIEFLVKASYIEIYMERIRDLLDASKDNLKVREEKNKGIWVEGTTEVYVSSESDVLEVITAGAANRAIAETKMNSESSRSHSIFILTVNQKNLNDLSNKTGKMYLVDLAGSEKVEKTGAQGTTLDEAKMINKSLSSLGNVINALTDGKSAHVPYRDSKLTRVLQESLGGNSRTTLIINCSPSSFNEAETLSTLRFGTRAKSIKNSAKINAERSVAELKLLLSKSEKEIEKMQSTISILQEEVNILRGGGTLPPTSRSSLSGSTSSNSSTDTSSINSNANNSKAEVPSLAGITKLQDKCAELENMVRKLEEEKVSISDMHESFLEELKEKEQELEMVDLLKNEIKTLRENEQNLNKENELLIVKLADITIENEKMQYDNNEQQLQLENLSVQNNALSQELNDIKKVVENLTNEKKAQQLKEEEESKEELLVEKSSTSKEAIQNAKAEHELLSALRIEIESQKNQIDFLKKEKEIQDASIKKLRSEYEQQLLKGESTTNSTDQASTSEQDNKAESRIERELQLVKEQTNQKLLEFDALKTALLRDLENRCQKVIELEILLDEAREQYQTLLVQVKNSNSKTLQQKCVFLQRNLEQLTAVQQQLVNENNRLKLENQVCVKQLAIRNERIHGLEMLLQDAQEKLQKHATNNSNDHVVEHLKEKNASFKRGVTLSSSQRKSVMGGGGNSGSSSGNTSSSLLTSSAANAHGGRIAKPIRGGGKANTEENTNTSNSSSSFNSSNSPTSPPESKRSSSIWDIFRSTTSKKSEESPSSTFTGQQQQMNHSNSGSNSNSFTPSTTPAINSTTTTTNSSSANNNSTSKSNTVQTTSDQK